MSFKKKLHLFLLTVTLVTVIFTPAVWAAPAAPITHTLTQPDGTRFKAKTKGDEWRNWTVTEEGYTILKDKASGNWVYAQQGLKGKLNKSSIKVGVDTPVGILKGLIPKATVISPNTFGSLSQSSATEGPAIPQSPPLPGTGNHNVLVILVNFSNRTRTTTEAEWANRFFGATSSVKDYYNEVSYGNLSLVPAAESSGTVDNGIVSVNVGYAHPNTGGSTGDANRQLTYDALVAADSYVNFASFDSDTSGDIQTDELHVVIIAAGYETSYGGALGACAPNVWAHRWTLGWGTVLAPNLDGVDVADFTKDGGYTQFGELQDTTAGGCGTGTSYLATIGVMAHELGHDLWLPDEYDTDGSSEGIGNWGVMGGGSWNYAGGRQGDSPAHPNAWDKSYEGWLTPTQVTGVSTVSIPQVETSATVYQLLDNPLGVDWSFKKDLGTGEYFLVENRQQTGYDAGLPGCGILIWHIDETVTYYNSANADEWGRRLVALEQADGAFHLENKNNRGNLNDPYLSGGQFNDTTTPNSKLYDANASGVSVTVNDACGANMSVTIEAPLPYPCPIYVPDDFLTIKEAITAATDGCEIIVRDGTYTENINFYGKLITIRSENGSESTIIDGNGGYAVSFSFGENQESILNGFKIINSVVGISIYNSSSPKIVNCTITSSTGYGITLSGNSSPLISNCTIRDNYGTGIRCTSSSPTITNCTINRNSANQGGGIYFESSSPTITNCTINSNSATSGGGIYCNSSLATITNCTINSNSATSGGGGIYLWNSSPSINNCTIIKNTGTWVGGGIQCDSSSPTITNCTIGGNSTHSGGAVYCNGTASPTVVNSVLWSNTAIWSGNEIRLESNASITITYSNIQGGFVGTGNIDFDPKFINATNGDYHLQTGSPCIDAANSDSPAPTTDKDGNPRYDDPDMPNTGIGTNGSYYDIGAYEKQPTYVWKYIINDTRLTSDGAYSEFPNLGVANSGNVHIAWMESWDVNLYDSKIYYTKLDNNGATVVDDTKLTSAVNGSIVPSLGLDGVGNIHIAWQDRRNGISNAEIYYTKLDNNGATVVADTRLTSESSWSAGPSLGVDSAGNIHIAWIDQRNGNYEIYYTKLDNNGNTVVDDTRLTTAGSVYGFPPSLEVDSSNNIHIAWADQRDGNPEIYYTKLDNNGNTLVEDTRLTFDSAYSYRPSLGVDSTGNVHIVWEDNRDNWSIYEIYYTKLDNNGNTLVNDTKVTSSASSSDGMRPSLGVDSLGNVHIVWMGKSSIWSIYYIMLNNNGTIVANKTRLTYGWSYYPNLEADSSNNIHIAWSNDVGGSNTEIYYTKGGFALNTNPNVSVDSPNGGEIWSGTKNILWTATDTEQTRINGLSATLYYGASATGPWTQIATGLSFTSGLQVSYSWDTTSVSDGTYWVQIVVSDGFGGSSEDVSNGSFVIDNTAPGIPMINSSTHPDEGAWYTNDNPIFTWSIPSDTSGINGYSYVLDHVATTIPDTTSEGIATTKSYTNVADGTWYFHVRAVDGSGKWGAADHYKINIDTVSPNAPVISSSTHPNKSTWYINNDPIFFWTVPSDVSGISGYSYVLDQIASTMPDTISEGTATNKSYADVADGTWYFHVRAVDGSGKWGATDHYTIKIDTLPTMEPIVELQGQYYNVVPTFSNFGFDDVIGLDDGWYQMDSYAGAWISLFTNVLGLEWNSDGWAVPAFNSLSEGSHTIYFKASDDASNVEGESGEWSWQFYKDITTPGIPTISSSSHPDEGTWYGDYNPVFTWTTPSDTSGINGYSYVLDQVATTMPDTTSEGLTTTKSYTNVADGTWYFHVRARDGADNWGSTDHYTINIDSSLETTPPGNVTNLQSTSHSSAIAQWNDPQSKDNTVDVSWTAAIDTGGSGLDGYSVLWDTSPTSLPDTTKDIEENATSATSAALANGKTHYFHIRSVDNAGNWAAGAAHIGPFYIDSTHSGKPTPVQEIP